MGPRAEQETATGDRELDEARAALARDRCELENARAQLIRERREVEDQRTALARERRELLEARAALAGERREVEEARLSLARARREEAERGAAGLTPDVARARADTRGGRVAPAPAPSRRGWLLGLAALAGVCGTIVAVAALDPLGMVETRGSLPAAVPSGVAVPAAVASGEAPADAHAPEEAAREPDSTVAAVGETAGRASQAPRAGGEPARGAVSPRASRPAEHGPAVPTAGAATPPAPARETSTRPTPAGGRLTDLFADDRDAKRFGAPASAGSPSLEVVAHCIRRRASELLPCIKAARERDEILAGSYNLTLGGRVLADGKVAGVHVIGPAALHTPATEQCILAIVGGWTLETSGAEVDLAEVGIGPLSVR